MLNPISNMRLGASISSNIAFKLQPNARIELGNPNAIDDSLKLLGYAFLRTTVTHAIYKKADVTLTVTVNNLGKVIVVAYCANKENLNKAKASLKNIK